MKKKIEDVDTDSKITEEFIEAIPKRQIIKDAPQTWLPQELNPFVVGPVESQVEDRQPIEYLTEMREITIQFINIIPGTTQESKLIGMINRAYQIVCTIVSKVKGVVNKVSLFDKDVMMLVLFGLRGVKHELESQNALKSAYEIRKTISKMSTVKNVSVGITNGLVYCGVVGHPFRREYTVIGGAVNKAARIMCAFEDKVTCDHETYKSCKISSLYFQLLSAVKLKGIEDAGHIFEYNESFQGTAREEPEAIKLFGRDKEVEFVDQIIKDPITAKWYAICFKAEPKVGNTKLLKTLFVKYRAQTKFIASVSLNPVFTTPYYCISNLYTQLYDVMSTEKPSIVQNLPKHLWDFNEVLKKKNHTLEKANDPAIILKNFLELCEGDPKKCVILFVDNMEHIDMNSLEILDQALKSKCLRLICAGCFEDHTTWNRMWKLSLSNQIKLLSLQPLDGVHVVPLVCNFLNVKGISKRLAALIEKSCENRPGWIQTCLLTLINNGGIEVKYVEKDYEHFFDENVQDSDIVLIATFSKKYVDKHQNSIITMAAITLDLFDSFSPYHQLIVKTAAVLGEIFTRTILLVLLQYPKENVFASAIRVLFEEDIFECGSRYINSGGLLEQKNCCICFRSDEDYNMNAEEDLPRYAYCKLMYFKSRNIRMVAYELLPQNQKKELHLKITDLLENQNNNCPNCLRDNSASIWSIRKFQEMVHITLNKYVWRQDPKFLEDHATEDFKNIIRAGIRDSSVKDSHDGNEEIPKRKLWDPSTCFCLEILTKVYRDLIYHSRCAEHLGKQIFFMVQYCIIQSGMDEYSEVISILTEASELCMTQYNDRYIFTKDFKKIMLGKIHNVLAYGYVKSGQIAAAKNHIILSLRQYNVPLISFSYKLPYYILNRIYMNTMPHTSEGENSNVIKTDFASVMVIISMIYAAEGSVSLAKTAIGKAVTCFRQHNSNLSVLSDVYTTAIDLYADCGDFHTCEKLERGFYRDALRYFTHNVTSELFNICKVCNTIFISKVMAGKLVESVRLGFRALYMHTSICGTYFFLELIPPLATVLLMTKRIDEAVYVSRLMFNIGKKYSFEGFIGYYAFCIELILETNFYLEPIQKIEEFTRVHVRAKKKRGVLATKLIIYLDLYYVRIASKNFSWHHAYDFESQSGIVPAFNLFKYIEASLIELYRMHESNKETIKEFLDMLMYYFKICKKYSDKWVILKPRYLHYQAYLSKIKNKVKKALDLLKEASKQANEQGNILEECWTTLHYNCWTGGFNFGKIQTSTIDWKLAKSYSSLQWCHILYALPYF